MFLPALTLTLAYLGEYALVMRSSLLDTMREDYLVLARAKGLRDVVVRNRHAVPNALLPVVTLIAINFGFVLSGAIAVEAIFSWPGLGLLTYDALRGPDLPMLQGLFVVFSASVIVFNLLAELLVRHSSIRGCGRRELHRGRPHCSPDRVAAAAARVRGGMGRVPAQHPGMIGLVVLILIVAMALAGAPAGKRVRTPRRQCGRQPDLGPPVGVPAARDGQPGPQRVGAVRLGARGSASLWASPRR